MPWGARCHHERRARAYGVAGRTAPAASLLLAVLQAHGATCRLGGAAGFHDLRQCVALLVAEGAHQLTIMRRLGHSSIQVTLGTCDHLFPELEDDVTQRLDVVVHAARERRAS